MTNFFTVFFGVGGLVIFFWHLFRATLKRGEKIAREHLEDQEDDSFEKETERLEKIYKEVNDAKKTDEIPDDWPASGVIRFRKLPKKDS